ncbi:hypothetical protein F5Y11DRAFT_41483 [Daldinia sp. FL1419]|nr:hypothetical protein F5Y11DRAFT_41483 [Daldinia sp. FL1419]
MAQRPDFQRRGSFGSDTSSFYSVRSGSADSAYSVWSASESDSFVWRDDPYGVYGVGGAVTRYVDERDDSRRRFAAHILSGPFAQLYKKKRHTASHSHSHARPGRSAHHPRSNSRSSTGSVSPGPGHFHDPRFGPPPPPPPGPQYHEEQFHEEQFHEEQFHEEQFHQEPYPQAQAPFHPGFRGGPPPPPPPPPAPTGFEGGFIQLNGPPPPQDDLVWGNDAGYGPGVHVYDS